MQLINGALVLNAKLLFELSGSVAAIIPFTIIYASLKSHKSDLQLVS